MQETVSKGKTFGNIQQQTTFLSLLSVHGYSINDYRNTDQNEEREIEKIYELVNINLFCK